MYVPGYSVLTLAASECTTIQDAKPIAGAPICVLGAGTGLGQCYLTTSDNEEYTVWPSEGGHCEFAPRTEQEVELLQFLKSKYNEDFRVSVERIVSLKGLVNVYEFLTRHAKRHATPEVRKLVGRDQHVNIAKRSESIMSQVDTDSVSNTALDILVSTYGAEAGCAALKWLPYGGLYVIGKIVQRCPGRFTNSDIFMDAFKDKGRVSPTIAAIPVKMVVADDLIMRGCYYLAIKTLRQLDTDRTIARSFVITKDGLLRFATFCFANLALGGLFWKFGTKRT
ncbi:glucokinase [Sphaeroforma arctica JP610]|uniref:Glucokinase n=1 Tax=Sphaeroforma arctica JP610 TaxID=667725 RepID=A0A0L0FPB6_9EUKA|nr:glucokinase [Sphaeroforma arctica JP610]KNC78642.1 glucokinase [Sphaeroforma arctica JP610]|eukprot:XP_014152544.1 glucokinase [Sphaeroforma arctica JP610]